MLKIYFDNEFLEFDDEDLDFMYLDEGAEGIVYKYGKDAIKIYKDYCFRSRLNLGQCEKLSSIQTKRILLPEKIVYGEDVETFLGYSTPFIYKLPCKKILDMNISSFVDELDLISSDLKVLAENGVEIEDWHINNVLYNGKLFVGDPGGMIFRSKLVPKWSLRNNIFTLNRFLKDDIFSLVKMTNGRKENIENFFDDFSDIGMQIRESCNSSDTVKKYIKRISK